MSVWGLTLGRIEIMSNDLHQFLNREQGDSGILVDAEGTEIPFEVLRREIIAMSGAQKMIRLVCQAVLTGAEFNLDANKVHSTKVTWD